LFGEKYYTASGYKARVGTTADAVRIVSLIEMLVAVEPKPFLLYVRFILPNIDN